MRPRRYPSIDGRPQVVRAAASKADRLRERRIGAADLVPHVAGDRKICVKLLAGQHRRGDTVLAFRFHAVMIAHNSTQQHVARKQHRQPLRRWLDSMRTMHYGSRWPIRAHTSRGGPSRRTILYVAATGQHARKRPRGRRALQPAREARDEVSLTWTAKGRADNGLNLKTDYWTRGWCLPSKDGVRSGQFLTRSKTGQRRLTPAAHFGPPAAFPPVAEPPAAGVSKKGCLGGLLSNGSHLPESVTFGQSVSHPYILRPRAPMRTGPHARAKPFHGWHGDCIALYAPRWRINRSSQMSTYTDIHLQGLEIHVSKYEMNGSALAGIRFFDEGLSTTTIHVNNPTDAARLLQAVKDAVLILGGEL